MTFFAQITLASTFLAWHSSAIAQDAYETALSPIEAAMLEDHRRAPTPSSADALVAAGDARRGACVELHGSGKHAEAADACSAALALVEAAIGPDHPDLSGYVNDLAVTLQKSGRLVPAEALYRRALAVTEVARGPDHSETGMRLHHLGTFLSLTGRWQEAETLLRRALDISERALGPDNVDTGSTLNDLGKVLLELGRYEEAEEAFRHILVHFEGAGGPDQLFVFGARNNLARLLQETGRYDEAEQSYRLVITRLESVLGPDDPVLARILNNLCTLLKEAGRYDEAEPLGRRAIALAEAAGGQRNPLFGVYLNTLATIFEDTGRTQQAEEYYRHALEVTRSTRGPDHPEVGTRLHNLAGLLRSTGRYDEAEPLARHALEIAITTVGDRHLVVGMRLSNLAWILADAGRNDEAESLFLRALEIIEAACGSEHALVGTSLNRLALFLRAVGRLDEAEEHFQRAYQITKNVRGADHPNVATNLTNLGDLHVMQQRPVDALNDLRRALRAEDAHIGRTLLTGTRRQRHLRLGQFESTIDITLTLQQDKLPDSTDAAELALQTMLRRKGLLADLERATLQLLREHANPEGLALLDRYQRAVAWLSVLHEQNPIDPVRMEEWQATRDRIVAQVEDLERRMAEHSAEFRQVTQPVTVEQVAAALPRGAVLLEVGLYQPRDFSKRQWLPERYVAYLLRGDGHIDSVDLGLASDLDAQVRELRRTLASPPSHAGDRALTNDVDRSARTLFETCLGPLWNAIEGTTQLYFAADGLLNLVPLEVVLREGPTGADQIQVSYLTSGRDLTRFADMTPPSDSVVVYDVDYDLGDATQSRGTWQALPGTSVEGRAVLRALRGARALTAADATETTIKQLRRPRVLHIASHGYFRSDLPTTGLEGTRSNRLFASEPIGVVSDRLERSPLLRSGIVLAGANAPALDEDNGLLTAAEFANIDLRGTALVVLSACESGSGEVRSGDGVHGLRRGLVLAGSRAQVLSLWKVDDEATAALMKAFYRRLRRGDTVVEALRRARTSVAEQARWTHPYYWAAFTVSGDAGTRPRR